MNKGFASRHLHDQRVPHLRASKNFRARLFSQKTSALIQAAPSMRDNSIKRFRIFEPNPAGWNQHVPHWGDICVRVCMYLYTRVYYIYIHSHTLLITHTHPPKTPPQALKYIHLSTSWDGMVCFLMTPSSASPHRLLHPFIQSITEHMKKHMKKKTSKKNGVPAEFAHVFFSFPPVFINPFRSPTSHYLSTSWNAMVCLALAPPFCSTSK